MEPERWRQVEELLYQALACPVRTRRAYLDQACGDDGALRRQVESLIRADEMAGRFLDQPLLEKAAAEGGIRNGRHLGPYRLLRKIGEGGMSVVYLAVRDDDEYRRRVAMKIVRFDAKSERQLRRFRTERQILASLDHPSIARLFEGGTTEEGLPYFAMEYIEGEPIDAYCDHHRLSIRERLELFRTVCSAVHYAHQNLVVHRDLKPANILVTAQGVPKLLDFGIAKLLNPDLTPSGAEPTVTWLRVLTPEYASPEQVQGRPITTASDVFSLGVLLYKLLTGRLPHHFASRTPQEIERVLMEEEPEKPSRALGRSERAASAAEAAAISRARGLEPAELRRHLVGDLDNIVAMALRKEPQRRYGSAEQFSEDLRRHLNELPVVAHPDTFVYRAGKFLRRHRLAVGVAAAFAALVAVAAGLLGAQAARIAHERDRAQRERDKARQVAAFLEEIFQHSDPRGAAGETVTAREILDRGAERIGEAGERSDVQAALMNTMGRIYRELGLYDRADTLLRRALDVRSEILGRDHPEVAESLHDLGQLEFEQGDYEAAQDLLRQSLEIRRNLAGEGLAGMAPLLCDLATVAWARGDFAAAEALYREALTRIPVDLHPEPPEVPEIKNSLGNLRYSQGDYQEAENLYREALAIWQRTLGEKHPTTAMAVNNLATALAAKGDYAGAIAGFRESLVLQRNLLGAEHPDLALTLSNLGALLYRQARYAEAEPIFREALSIRRKALGDEHPAVGESLNNLGSLLRDRGAYAEAEPLLRQAVALWRESLGEDHPHVAGALSNLAWLLHLRGDFASAEPVYREALARRRDLLGPDHPALAYTLVGLGQLLTATGELLEAETLLREAVEIRRRKLPADHWETALAESALGECLTRSRRYTEAEPLLVESYRRIAAARPANDRETLLAGARVGALYTAWNKPEKAAEYPHSSAATPTDQVSRYPEDQ